MYNNSMKQQLRDVTNRDSRQYRDMDRKLDNVYRQHEEIKRDIHNLKTNMYDLCSLTNNGGSDLCQRVKLSIDSKNPLAPATFTTNHRDVSVVLGPATQASAMEPFGY